MTTSEEEPILVQWLVTPEEVNEKLSFALMREDAKGRKLKYALREIENLRERNAQLRRIVMDALEDDPRWMERAREALAT